MTPDFVGTNGTAFQLNGKPIRLVGANNYYLGFASDAMVKPVFELAAQLNLNVLRTWAFLDCGLADAGATPGNAKDGAFFQYWNSLADKPDFNDGANGLERLDRTIAWAEQYGIRLILPFVNYWDDFGGANQYLKWFGLSDRDRFYSNAGTKQAYRNYVGHLVARVNTRTGRRYADEPAILAWELANEPRCMGPQGTDTLIDWIDEMSAYVKSLDPNHLLGVGDEGYFCRKMSWGNKLYNGSFGVDCERILSAQNIDFGTCHLYPNFAGREDPVEFGSRWILEHLEAGSRANKPMLIEEYGYKIESTDSRTGLTQRNAAFQAWLDRVLESNGAGALVWMIASAMPDGNRYPDYDGYTVYSAEDVPSILAYAPVPPEI